MSGWVHCVMRFLLEVVQNHVLDRSMLACERPDFYLEPKLLSPGRLVCIDFPLMAHINRHTLSLYFSPLPPPTIPAPAKLGRDRNNSMLLVCLLKFKPDTSSFLFSLKKNKDSLVSWTFHLEDPGKKNQEQLFKNHHLNQGPLPKILIHSL